MPSLRTTPFLALTLLFLGAPMATSAASYYVAPNGSGSTCSSASPCLLNEGLNRAGAGDEVVLKNGTYRQDLVTMRHGSPNNHVVIRAENRHQAVVNGNDSAVDINHDYITVRGIKFDNQGRGRRGYGMVDFHPTSSNSPINNVIIEDNLILNSGSGGVYMNTTENVIIRHNLIERTGLAPDTVGEGFYIGHNAASPLTRNIEIYGNTIRYTQENFVDYKPPTRNMYVHHNIFEHHEKGDGLIRSGCEGSCPNSTSGNRFENNVVRKAVLGCCSILSIRSHRVDVKNNVFDDIQGGAWSLHDGARSEFSNNTSCDTSSNDSATNVVRTGNRFNQPQSACDAEVARILNEMKSLPGPGAGATFPDGGTPVFTPGPCSLYPSGSPGFSPYGLAWDWTTTQRELLLKATCETDSTTLNIGNGRETGSGATMAGLTYVYHQGYYNAGSGWQPYSLQCFASDKTKVANAWCKGSATASLPASARWFVAYTCIWTGAKWQCGCSDASCATSFWQVQGIRR